VEQFQFDDQGRCTTDDPRDPHLDTVANADAAMLLPWAPLLSMSMEQFGTLPRKPSQELRVVPTWTSRCFRLTAP
jgi:hypothetical protein